MGAKRKKIKSGLRQEGPNMGPLIVLGLLNCCHETSDLLHAHAINCIKSLKGVNWPTLCLIRTPNWTMCVPIAKQYK